MEEHKFALVNNKPTRHLPGVPSLLIDHIVTNNPGNVDSVMTHATHISDDESVSYNFRVQLLNLD